MLPSLLAVAGVNAQTPLPNAGFENWDDEGNYFEPTSWGSANECADQISVYSVAKSTDAYSGSFSARMVTQDYLTILKVNGVITTSAMNCDPFNPGIAGGVNYTERPDSVVGWYKYWPQGNDNAYVQVMLLNTMVSPVDTIGYVKYDMMDEVAVWTRFSAAIVYDSEDTHDLSSVLFNSSWGNGNENEGVHGSELRIDDVAFVFNPTGITENANADKWGVYPNPVAGELTIKYAAGADAFLEILDATGKQVRYQKVGHSNSVIDVSELTTGLYIYQLKSVNDGILRTGRLMVQQ